VLLYPLYHPAAALYTPAMQATLEADFARIPALVARGAGPAGPAMPDLAPEPVPVAVGAPEPEPEQLGLF